MWVNETTDDIYERTNVEIIIIAFFLLVLIIFSILGNLAVIVAILNSYNLRDELSNGLIINLAITDLINGSIVMPSSLIAVTFDEWNLGSVFCDFICDLNYCLIIVSMLTLSFISVDRYHAILNPLSYACIITGRRIKSMTCYTWFQGIVFGVIPSAFHWIEYDYWEVVCAIQWQIHRVRAIYYVIVAFIMCFFVPCIVVTFCYINILREIRKSRRVHVVIERTNNTDLDSYHKSFKAIGSLLVVVMTFFICMTPFCVTKLLKVMSGSPQMQQAGINTAASLMHFCSSAINPLIYGIFRKDFRAAYKKLLFKMKLLKDTS